MERSRPNTIITRPRCSNNGTIPNRLSSIIERRVETDPKHATAHAALVSVIQDKQMTDAKIESRWRSNSILKLESLLLPGKARLSDYANALAALKALREPEFKQKALIERGCCYIEANSQEKPLPNLTERSSASTDDSSNDTLHARYFLATCYEKQRDIDKAIGQWEKIFVKKRNFRDVGEKLTQYQELRSNDHMKEYLTASKDDFFTICKALTNKCLELAVREIKETKYGCSLIAVENDAEKWRNVRKMPRMILFYRDPNMIEDAFLRTLQEEMKKQSIIRGIVITSSGFTRTALEFAESRPLELINKDKLEQMLSQADVFAENQ